MVQTAKPSYIKGTNPVHTGFKFVPSQAGCRYSARAIAASTSMLFLRRLPPNEAWLLVFRDGVLRAVFILLSVTEVEMTT